MSYFLALLFICLFNNDFVFTEGEYMIPWWLGILMGSICLAFKNSFSRMWDITPINILYMQIPLILAGLFYWYGFKNAPVYVNCWFLGTAFNAVFAILLGVMLFDKSLSITTIIGVILVLSGAYLLVKC